MSSFVELKFGEKDIRAFFDKGFSIVDAYPTPLHRHMYSEIHIVVSGKMKYYVEDKELILEKGTAIFIPAKKFHRFSYSGEDAEFIAFQLDLDVEVLKCGMLSPQIFESFINSLRENQDKIEKIVPYVYWIISELIADIQVSVKKNTDYSYLIYEFFCENYNKDISLSDLAKALHISEKQTQRIIKRETGNTFLKELTYYRMKMAEYLINTYNMPLTKVAGYVGYSSYSGFWKVYSKNISDNEFLLEKSNKII